MLLSVLIPTYNNGNAIERCVRSALNQDYKDDYEVIVVNNASTDNTSSILANIKDSRLRVYTNEVTVSMFANHNISLEKATSDYIIFLHGDDQLTPEALKIFASKVKERMYPQRYILYGHSMIDDPTEWGLRTDTIAGFNIMFSGETALRMFLTPAAPQPTGTLFSRQALLDIGAFWALPETTPEDWTICLWAAFNYFEFEMCDRLLFIREESNSWNHLPESEKTRKQNLITKALVSRLNAFQKEKLRDYCLRGMCPMFNHIFIKPKTIEQRIQEQKALIKQKPWGYHRWKGYFELKRQQNKN